MKIGNIEIKFLRDIFANQKAMTKIISEHAYNRTYGERLLRRLVEKKLIRRNKTYISGYCTTKAGTKICMNCPAYVYRIQHDDTQLFFAPKQPTQYSPTGYIYRTFKGAKRAMNYYNLHDDHTILEYVITPTKRVISNYTITKEMKNG
jgi:predicted transcriptional regulator